MNDNHHDQSADELFRLLRAANPISEHTVPGPQSPHAQQLLENIMNENQWHSDGSPTPSTSDSSPNPEGFPIETPQLADISQWRDRATGAETTGVARHPSVGQRMVFVAAAAVLVVAAIGFVLFRPSGTGDALADVQNAAASTANVDSGEVVVDFGLRTDDVDGDGVTGFSGVLEASFVRGDIAIQARDMTEEFSSDADEFGSVDQSMDILENAEMRLVDDVLYVNEGSGQWLALPGPSGIGSTIIEFIDPREILRAVEDLTDVQETGVVDAGGQTLTVYEGTIDLSEVSLDELEWLPVPAEAVGEVSEEFDGVNGVVDVELRIADDGLLQMVGFDAALSHDEHPEEVVEIAVQVAFENLNGDITVEAPANAVDMSDMFGGDREGMIPDEEPGVVADDDGDN